MLGLYISNQKDPLGFFQRGLKDLEIETLVAFPTFKSEYDLFQTIKSKSPDLIILNSNLAFCDKATENFTGVSFLRYLRMLGFNKHCICFGQETLEDMIKKSFSNAVLLSTGNSFVIPFQTKMEETISATTLQTQTDNSNLLEIVKGNLDFEKVKHEWANYWGIYRLFEAHQKFDKNFAAKKLEEILPENLKQKLFSYEGVALRYLYGKQKPLNSKDTTQQIYSCNTLRKKLKESNPKVLYIDDQSNFGWSEILQEIIYGQKEETLFKTIKPEANFNEEKLVTKLCNEIVQFEPHILLLDVRLRNEKGFTSNPDELSGLKLLAKIRTKIPNMPVIMFTASNKAKTIIRCKELGAYDVWTKEGIDERLSNEHSLTHYTELVRLIYECVSYVSERANKFLFGLEFPLAQFEEKSKAEKFQKWLDLLEKNHKFKILLFNQFDICILDTNIFLYNAKATLSYYKTLICLFGVRKSWGKNIAILNATYDEMIKHAKFHYNKYFTADNKDIRCKMARFALNKLQEFNDKKWVYVNNHSSTFDAKAYADPEFASLVHRSISNSETILFITNDNALREEIFESVAKKYGKSQNHNYRLMKGNEMIDIFKPLVKLIDTIE